MWHGRTRSLLAFIATLCLTLQCLSQESARPGSAPADETAIRLLVDKFFTAFAEGNVEGLMFLWSAKSPEFESRKKELQKIFSDLVKIEVKGLVITKLTIQGEGALLRLALEMNGVVAKTGKPVSGMGKVNRTLKLVKEGGAWKVWDYVPSELELAANLAAAKTEGERKRLLGEESELVDVELRKWLITEGERLRLKGDYTHALTILGLAQAVAEQVGDQVGVVWALLNQGIAYSTQGNRDKALEYYQKSLALAEAVGEKLAMAHNLNNIGIIHNRHGDYNLALEYFRKSLALHEQLGNAASVAAMLNSMGSIYRVQTEYQLALETFKKSLAVSERLADRLGIANSLNQIGVVHYSQGDYPEALEYYRRSLVLLEALKNNGEAARVLNNIGIVYRSQGNYGLAAESIQTSLALRRDLGDKGGIANGLNSLANVYSAQRNYGLALEYYQKSMTLYTELENKPGIAQILIGIGKIRKEQGHYDQALESYQKSLAILEALGNRTGLAAVLNNIGETYSIQGNYDLAMENCRKSLKLSEALDDKQGIASAMDSIAHIEESQGNHSQALEFAEPSASISRQTGKLETLWRSLTTAGAAYNALKRPADARRALEEAISTVETMRSQIAGGEQEQQRFFEDKVSPYQEMVRLLIAQNNVREALAYAERAKARVLADVLSSGRVNVNKALTSQEQEQERKLKGELVSLNTQIARASQSPQPDQARLADLKSRLEKARLDYEAFQTNLYAAHPQLKTQRGEAQPIKLEEVAALLPDSRTAALEFVVTQDKTYLFVLTKDGDRSQAPVDVKVYTLPVKQKDLADRSERFRQQIAKEDLDFQRLARELYDLLLKPAQNQLQGKTTLVIVPDDALWNLPFQALQPTANHYVIEKQALFYSPSLTVLREMFKGRGKQFGGPSTSTLLAFGNPAVNKETAERVQRVLMDEKLEPLPEAEKQVAALRQLYGPAQTRVYVGADAREDRAKAEAGGYRMLQFATHGVLNDSSPMYSHLVLSQTEGDSNEDGLLEAWEMMNLDLHADMVVLSACETARGRVGAGEGIIGMSWALFVAGAPTTVVSQWKVESASTTQLMLEFHRNIKAAMQNPKTQVSKAKAMQQASIKLLKSGKYTHPFYWAGFVVVGDGY
jgi:CHAT domain-containing protein/tetratricopeptide (TPR) repeat protein